MKQIFTTSLVILAALVGSAQPASFNAKGIGGGGAIFALSINPAHNAEYYAACDMGELFHTTNFGDSYDQVNFQQLIAGHNSKVCFTSSVGLLYSINYANDKVVPVKSIDNGVTWTTLSGNLDDSEETFSIDADYNSPNRVIISYYTNIYFSGDGGVTFNSVHTALNSSAGNVVGGVVFDGNTIYIGTNDGVLVSTNGGQSWTTASIGGLPANEQIWSFAGAHVGTTTRFFCITAAASDIYVGVLGSDYYSFPISIYSVDYGSGTWTPKMTGVTTTTDFPMFVRMASNDINTVYTAGSNSNSYPDIMKSTNAGAAWTHVFNTTSNQNITTGWSGQGGDRNWGYGECAFDLAVASTSTNSLLFGDYGFIHKSKDGGSDWKQAYVDSSSQHGAGALTAPNNSYQSCGLENTSCWQVHWSNASTLWSCFSDIRGIKSTDGGNSWSFNYTGNIANSTYRVAHQPNGGTLFAATSNIHDMYQSTRLQDAQLDANDPQGKILYSTDNGSSWQNLKTFNHPVFWITLDPNNSNRAYASVIHYNGGGGMGGVYVCSDLQNLATSTWSLLPDPPRTEKHPASIVVLNDGKMVCSYSGRRTSGGVFTASSGVFIYNPATNGWTDVSDTGMHYWTKDITIDPNDASQNTWYAGVFSGWGGPPNGLGGLYKTTNRGANWTKLTSAATIDRVTSCTFDPNNANQVFMTTETNGLWFSTTINAAAPTFSLVKSYPFQQPERVFFNPYVSGEVWVSSFGNGMKAGNVNIVTGVLEFKHAGTSLNVFPNPSTGLVELTLEDQGLIGSGNLKVFDLNGKLLIDKPVVLNSGPISLNFSNLENGIYLIRLWTGDVEVRNQKLVIAR